MGTANVRYTSFERVIVVVLYAGDVTIDAAVDYVFRSDGIDRIIGASGVRLSLWRRSQP